MAVDQELSATLERVAAAFETVAVPWAIGGSFASTLYGEPRALVEAALAAIHG